MASTGAWSPYIDVGNLLLITLAIAEKTRQKLATILHIILLVSMYLQIWVLPIPFHAVMIVLSFIAFISTIILNIWAIMHSPEQNEDHSRLQISSYLMN